jgi:hypothetical protein
MIGCCLDLSAFLLWLSTTFVAAGGQFRITLFSTIFSLSFTYCWVFMGSMATKSDLVPSSTFNAPMTPIKFNRKKYIYWVRSVEMFL